MALNKRIHTHGYLLDQEFDRLDENVDRVAACFGMVEWFIGAKATLPKTHHALDGRVISRQENPRLFNYLGERWGGDGEVTFGLPDLSLLIPRGAPPKGPVGTQITHTVGTGASSLISMDFVPCVRAG